MSEDGYIQLALDNRGTPSLLGASWRKSIYRRNGQINIRDMAMGVRKVLEFPYIDKERVAVWGWSGGGSSTLHLMFQFPDLFKIVIDSTKEDTLVHMHWLAIAGIVSFIGTLFQLIPIDNSSGSKLVYSYFGRDNAGLVASLFNLSKFIFLFLMILNIG